MSKASGNAKAPNKVEAVPATQALTTQNPAKGVLAMMEGAETGFEGTDAKDYSIPFLSMIQKLSPQCDRDNSAYDSDAQPGMFFDAGTGELLTSVRLIPCHYKHAIVEWKPDRKGLAGTHEPGIEEGMKRNEKGIPEDEKGNLFMDTRYFFCLRLQDDGSASPVVVSLGSTQIKKAKIWMTRMQSIKVDGKGTPMYSQIWKATASDEKNDKGTWKGWKFDFEGFVPDELIFQKAKESRDMFKSTEVKPQTIDEDGSSASKATAAM